MKDLELDITTHLDPALLPGSGIVIPSSDPISHLGPQPPALPLSLLLDRLDRDLVLGDGRVGEHLVRLGDLANPGPGSLVGSDGLAVVGQDGLVRVSLTRDPACAGGDERSEMSAQPRPNMAITNHLPLPL